MLLSSRQQAEGAAAAGNRSVATPNVGTADAEFLKTMLAQTRRERASALLSVPAGATDVRMYRVWIANGINDLVIQPR